jgi:death on curing protein
MRYLRLDHVLRIHERMIERFGGDPGTRDVNLVDSAVAQPRAPFGGESLYPTLAEKAAALGFSLTKNHGFVDGNKRTAAAAVEMFLLRNGYEIDAPVDEHEAIYLRLAASLLTREEYLAWLRLRMVRKGQ